MQGSNPAGKPAPEIDARHGDVDTNGDLVDRLRSVMPDESPIDLELHAQAIAGVAERARKTPRGCYLEAADMVADLFELGRLVR